MKPLEINISQCVGKGGCCEMNEKSHRQVPGALSCRLAVPSWQLDLDHQSQGERPDEEWAIPDPRQTSAWNP